MKTIIKNLWNRRRANAWLFIELILVTILTWVMLDPVVVAEADARLPMGFDTEHMAVVTMIHRSPDSQGYKAEYDSVDAARSAVESVMNRIRNFPGVVSAANLEENSLPGAQSISSNFLSTTDSVLNSKIRPSNTMYFTRGEPFFTTYGLKPEYNSPSLEELENMPKGDIVLTRQLADLYFPDHDAVGNRLMGRVNGSDTAWAHVAGVVSDMRWQSFNRSNCLFFFTCNSDPEATTISIVVCVAPEVDIDEFTRRFRHEAASDLAVGNLVMNSIVPYRNIIAGTAMSYGITPELNMAYLLCLFFLINLMLGTIGCFWLQTRKRVHEIGIRRAFGARRGNIVAMLLGESTVLALAAFLAGDALYLQWALKNGLDIGMGNNLTYNILDTWVSHFWPHFAIVSAVVCVIILAAVVIGTLIPAIGASRTDVTAALRDE